MKNINTLLLFLFLSLNAFSQTTDVITGLTQPISLVFNGNTLYYAEYNGGDGKISAIDVDAAIVPVEIVQNTDWAIGLIFKDDDLYFGQLIGNNISKIATDNIALGVTEIISNIRLYDFALQGSTLYISAYIQNKIYKIDISSPNPTLIEVVDGLSTPYGIALHNDELYIAEYDGNRISKINITESNPMVQEVISNVSSPSGLCFAGNILFIAEADGNKISHINVSSNQTSTTETVSNVSEPSGLAIYNNELYITEYNENKISKVNITSILSTEDIIEQNNTVSVFPNPTANFIKITGLKEQKKYKIFTINGAKVSDGLINDNQTIDTSMLSAGMYILHLENSDRLKFIKK
ncbi:T9SS type A sorting domain-containing protein [uncultured Kordia sp.]|uniref:T9SS type A sorting domain-containing protein n=1 Tax=uncultured Kordia sp. TaxID=507699 RepID=UPI002632480C|nr:T9SS type A sorting domain-containing protein [uncultured Kordia sp.]